MNRRPIPVQRFCTENGTLFGPHNFVGDYSASPFEAFVDLSSLDREYFVMTSFKIFLSEPTENPELYAWGSGGFFEALINGITLWTESNAVRLNIFDPGWLVLNFGNRIILPDYDMNRATDEQFPNLKVHGIDFAARGGGYPVRIGSGSKVGVTLNDNFSAITGFTEQHFLIQGFATDNIEQWENASLPKFQGFQRRSSAGTSVVIPPVLGAKYSVDLNGIDEYYQTGPSGSWQMGGSWALSTWAKPNSGVGIRGIFDMRRSSDNDSRIIFRLLSDTKLEAWVFIDHLLKKQYQWNNVWGSPLVSDWKHLALDWNDVNLRLHVNGVLTAPNTIIDNDVGVVGDTIRYLNYGSMTFGTSPFSGRLGHLGTFNVPLDTANYAAIFAGGFGLDLRVNSGAYTSAANLTHYYRPGFGGPGTDVGATDEVGLINFVLASNITSADIVEDAP